MNGKRASLLIVALLIPVVLGLAPAHSQDKGKARPKADPNNLLKEAMSLKLEEHQQAVAIWIPFEVFLELTLAPDASNREAMEEEIGYLKKYQILVLGISYEDSDGTRVYASKKDLEGRGTLKLATGEEFAIADKVPTEVTNLAEAFKQTMRANQGEMGKHLEVLIYSATAKDGKTVLKPAMKNMVIYTLKEGNGFKRTRLEWRTPFDALNPVPPCPRCNEPLSGKWTFCPWCGAKIDRK
jgi:hypothetical protein